MSDIEKTFMEGDYFLIIFPETGECSLYTPVDEFDETGYEENEYCKTKLNFTDEVKNFLRIMNELGSLATRGDGFSQLNDILDPLITECVKASKV